MKLWYTALFAVLLPLAPAAARAQEQAAAPAAEPGYLKPGDVVQLRIWREEDLSGEFPVDVDGAVVFPKIGRVVVTGLAPDRLKRELLDAYGKYLLNPSIEIVLLRSITILGAVNKPGVYPVNPAMTVADALALAGGASRDGKPDEVRILRDGERLESTLSRRSLIGESPLRSGDQLFVPERSWLARNTGLVATVISASTSLIVALILKP